GSLVEVSRKRRIGEASILASAAIYVISHPPFAVFPIFVAGCAPALAIEVTGSLWASVLAHIVHNAMVTFARRSIDAPRSRSQRPVAAPMSTSRSLLSRPTQVSASRWSSAEVLCPVATIDTDVLKDARARRARVSPGWRRRKCATNPNEDALLRRG